MVSVTRCSLELEAKPGKRKRSKTSFAECLPIVQEEPATTAWFGIRLGPTTFGIFDAFPDEAGRQAHLAGRVAAALMARAAELFSSAACDREDRRSGGQASSLNAVGKVVVHSLKSHKCRQYGQHREGCPKENTGWAGQFLQQGIAPGTAVFPLWTQEIHAGIGRKSRF